MSSHEMETSVLPPLLPWEPKSFYELAVSFSTPFNGFMSWCGRRNISKICKHDILPSKGTPIRPEQSYFDDLRAIAKRGGFLENGHFICRDLNDMSLILTAVLDFAARRVIPTLANDTQPSKPLSEFNAVPCNIMCQGMEAWILYQSKFGYDKPYMVALYLLPQFCRDDALEDFISTLNISHEPVSRSGPRAAFSQSETMWSLLFDACLSSQCTTFVVSSYSRWVLGEFTQDFTTANVSSIIDLDSKSPSVPEVLYQWIAHAFETKKAAEDDTVEEPPSDQDEWPLTFMDMQFHHHNKLYDLWGIQ